MSVADCPVHIVWSGPALAGMEEPTFTMTLSVAEQPLFVTVTVNVAVVAGVTIVVAVVAALLH